MKKQIVTALMTGMLMLGAGGVGFAQEPSQPDAAPTANVNVTTETTAPAAPDPVNVNVTAPAPAATSTSSTTTSDTTVIDRTSTAPVADNTTAYVLGGIIGVAALLGLVAMAAGRDRTSTTTVTRV